MSDSKRIKNLRDALTKELPFFPNNKSTKQELESQKLNLFLMHYLSWKIRIVPPRKRRTLVAPEVIADVRYSNLKAGIDGLLSRVQNGEDIYAYHSKEAHDRGYTPIQRVNSGEVDPWEDKDLLLNATGFHHFHLDMRVQHTGLSWRTNEVLFACVTRDLFHAVGIFDHDVFEPNPQPATLTAERERLLTVYKRHVFAGASGGANLIFNPTTLSGYPVALHQMGKRYAKTIRNMDPKLEDREEVTKLFQVAGWAPPQKFKFEWQFKGLDLIAFEKKTNSTFVIHSGHM